MSFISALTVDDITWACCELFVNHEQNLETSWLRFHHVVAVALPEAITECLARHHRELQRDLSDLDQRWFKPVAVGWILVSGNWIAECDLQARNILGIFITVQVVIGCDFCEDFLCFSSAPCGSTVSGLACSTDRAHSFHADHRLWGSKQQRSSGNLNRFGWISSIWSPQICVAEYKPDAS